MSDIHCRTRRKDNPNGKPRVYFTCHPEDFDSCFEPLCEDLFRTHDCAVYYTGDMTQPIPEQQRVTDLERSNLCLVPVTRKLLNTPNRAMDVDIPFFLEKRIPVLPVMMEPGLDELYAKPNKFGELQYLSRCSTDETEIAYADKLKRYLEAVLISDETAKRIRAAFDAYIFLSYRKKDRYFANRLMRMIHSNPECRDIAIWFDEFLTPGENFRESIEKALDDCSLFTLLVTPRLLEPTVDADGTERENYVLSTEIPLAKKKGTDIFAVEMEYTDRQALLDKGITEPIQTGDDALFRENLLRAVAKIAITANDRDAVHNLLIGLAYLEGLDMEVDRDLAAELITDSAEQGLPEAMEKLITMYTDGVGVPRDPGMAQQWSLRLARHYYHRCFDPAGKLQDTSAAEELFSHNKDPYWSGVIKGFLLEADALAPDEETVRRLYEAILSFGICEYTLLLEACTEMTRHREQTQLLLVGHILKCSAAGIYPPYGPLFWYVPAFELYEQAILVLQSMSGHSNYPKMLALVRDVCVSIGQKYTVAAVTDRVDGAMLYAAAEDILSGIRKDLCRMFCTGHADSDPVSNIYPRCFNPAETAALMTAGSGISGRMTVPFADELGLYQHSDRSTLDGEYIGIVSMPYRKEEIETVLRSQKCFKLSGLILSPTEETSLGYMAFHRSDLQLFCIPENIQKCDENSILYMHLNQCFSLNEAGIQYHNCRHLTISGTEQVSGPWFRNNLGIREVTLSEETVFLDYGVFSGCRKLKALHQTENLGHIGSDAFHSCTALTEVTPLPNLLRISSGAFAGCKKLQRIGPSQQLRGIGENAFLGCESLQEITLPDGLTELGKEAFRGCKSLTSIRVPGTVRNLEQAVFAGCSQLRTAVLEDGIESIEPETFLDCTNLETAVIPDSVFVMRHAIFQGCTNLKKVVLPARFGGDPEYFGLPEGVQIILTHGNSQQHLRATSSFSFDDGFGEDPLFIDTGRYAYQTELKTVVVPDSVQGINPNAFMGCTNLSELKLPGGLDRIAASAFADCVKLTRIERPSFLRFLGSHVFSGCVSLRQFIYTENLETIGEGAFAGCISLEQMGSFGKLQTIEKDAFAGCTSLKRLEPLEYVQTIGEGAFAGCINLEEIALPAHFHDRLEEIGISPNTKVTFLRADTSITIDPAEGVIKDSAYKGYSLLSHVQIPEGILEIQSHAFEDCISLIQADLPDTVTKIGYSAFGACEKLEKILLPDSVNRLDSRAFQGCSALSEVRLPRGLTYLSDYLFLDCGTLKSLDLPPNLRRIGMRTFYNCESLQTLDIPDSVTHIEECAFLCCYDLKSVSLPAQLTTLEKAAFECCESLETIALPDGIHTVPEMAFNECFKLAEVKLPNQLHKLEEFSFRNCRSLKQLTIPNTVCEIEEGAFKGCESLKRISIPSGITQISKQLFRGCTGLKSVTFGSGVDTIRTEAFYGCSGLVELDIPDHIRTIEDQAFAGCTGLESVRISANLKDEISRIFGEIDPGMFTYV